jgi:hypothetical protein
LFYLLIEEDVLLPLVASTELELLPVVSTELELLSVGFTALEFLAVASTAFELLAVASTALELLSDIFTAAIEDFVVLALFLLEQPATQTTAATKRSIEIIFNILFIIDTS